MASSEDKRNFSEYQKDSHNSKKEESDNGNNHRAERNAIKVMIVAVVKITMAAEMTVTWMTQNEAHP
jgi:hypothetical protein